MYTTKTPQKNHALVLREANEVCRLCEGRRSGRNPEKKGTKRVESVNFLDIQYDSVGTLFNAKLLLSPLRPTMLPATQPTSLKKILYKGQSGLHRAAPCSWTETADKYKDELQVPGEFPALLNHEAQMESRARSNRVSAMKAKQGSLSSGLRVKLGTKKVPPESPTNKDSSCYRDPINTFEIVLSKEIFNPSTTYFLFFSPSS